MSTVVRVKDDKLFKRIVAMQDSYVAVGWFASTRAHERTEKQKYSPDDDGLKPMAIVARDNEFGASGVPPRPFFRQTITEKSKSWVKLCIDGIRSQAPIKQVIANVGVRIEDDVKAKIVEFAAAGGNAPRTIELKGFDAPLIHTSQMMNSISSRIDEEGE